MLTWSNLWNLLTEPQIVESLDCLLKLHWNINVDILIETWFARHEAGQGRPVVGSDIVGGRLQLLFSPRQLCRLPLQFLLSSLEINNLRILYKTPFNNAKSCIFIFLCTHSPTQMFSMFYLLVTPERMKIQQFYYQQYLLVHLSPGSLLQ